MWHLVDLRTNTIQESFVERDDALMRLEWKVWIEPDLEGWLVVRYEPRKNSKNLSGVR